MTTATGAFMLIFRETRPESYSGMSPDQLETCLSNWNQWVESIAAQGKLQYGHPLQPRGCIVTEGKEQRLVDGPFSEAKEAIGGFLMLQVENQDEAIAIARQCPSLCFGMQVEVRPLATACHLAIALGRDTMLT